LLNRQTRREGAGPRAGDEQATKGVWQVPKYPGRATKAHRQGDECTRAGIRDDEAGTTNGATSRAGT